MFFITSPALIVTAVWGINSVGGYFSSSFATPLEGNALCRNVEVVMASNKSELGNRLFARSRSGHDWTHTVRIHSGNPMTHITMCHDRAWTYRAGVISAPTPPSANKNLLCLPCVSWSLDGAWVQMLHVRMCFPPPPASLHRIAAPD